jgi:hypothetical protein
VVDHHQVEVAREVGDVLIAEREQRPGLPLDRRAESLAQHRIRGAQPVDSPRVVPGHAAQDDGRGGW